MKNIIQYLAILTIIFFSGTTMANDTDLPKDKTLNISLFEVNRESPNQMVFEESITLPKDRSNKTITVQTNEKKGVFSAPITIEGVVSTESLASIKFSWSKKAKFYFLRDYYDPTEIPRKADGFTMLVRPQTFDKMQSKVQFSVDDKQYEVICAWAEDSTLPIISKTLHIEIFQENNISPVVYWDVRTKDIISNENSLSVKSRGEKFNLRLSNGENKSFEGSADILFNTEDPNFIVLNLDIYGIKHYVLDNTDDAVIPLVIPFAVGTKVAQKIRLIDGQTHEENFTLKSDDEKIILTYKLKWL